MKFEFRPEFRFDLKLEIVWPRIKGAFKGLASAFKGLVLPREGRAARLGRSLALALVLIAAAVAAAILIGRR